jgi:hypothetical protein
MYAGSNQSYGGERKGAAYRITATRQQDESGHYQVTQATHHYANILQGLQNSNPYYDQVGTGG